MSFTCPHNMVNFGLLAAEMDPVVWGTPANFKFRHLCSAWRPSRCALAHILVLLIFTNTAWQVYFVLYNMKYQLYISDIHVWSCTLPYHAFVLWRVLSQMTFSSLHTRPTKLSTGHTYQLSGRKIILPVVTKDFANYLRRAYDAVARVAVYLACTL